MKGSLHKIRKKQVYPFLVVITLSLIVLQSLSFLANSQFAKADSTTQPWAAFRHDATRMGFSNCTGLTVTPSVIWHINVGSSVISSPAVANGAVYFGAANGNVYGVNELTGQILWTWPTGGAVESSPAVSNGIVYIGSNDGQIYALNATTGAKIWNFTAGTNVRCSPTVMSGQVYVNSGNGTLYSLNASTGAPILRAYHSANATLWTSSPAVVNNRIYVGSSISNMIRIYNTTYGGTLGTCITGGLVLSSPAVAGAILYAGANDGKIYAFNATSGAQLWNYTTGVTASLPVQSSPAVSGSRLFVGGNDSRIYAIYTSDHSLAWTYTTGGPVFSSPAATINAVYVGSDDGKLYALSPTTGAELWNYSTGSIIRSSPAITDDEVIITTLNGDIIALGPQSTSTPTPTPTSTVTPIPPQATPTPTPNETPTPTPAQYSSPTPTPIGASDFFSWLSIRPVSVAEVMSASIITILAAAIATFAAISVNYVSSASAEAIATMPFPDWLKDFLKKYAESKFEDKLKKESSKPKNFSFISPVELGVLASSIVISALIAAFVEIGGIANASNLALFSTFLLAGLVSAVIMQTANFIFESYVAYVAGVKKKYAFWNIGTVMFVITGLVFMFPFSSLTTTDYAEKIPEKVKGLMVLTKKLMLLSLTVLFGFLSVTNFANLHLVGDSGLLLVLTGLCSALVPISPLPGKEIFKYKKSILAAILIPIALLLFFYQIKLFPLWIYSLIGIAALIAAPAVTRRLKTQKTTEKILQQQEDKYCKTNLC